MKRISTLCLILTLIVPFALPAEALSPTAAAALLADLTALLDAREQIYEKSSEAFTAVSRFLDQNDCASLLHARIVCDQTLRDVRLISIAR